MASPARDNKLLNIIFVLRALTEKLKIMWEKM